MLKLSHFVMLSKTLVLSLTLLITLYENSEANSYEYGKKEYNEEYKKSSEEKKCVSKCKKIKVDKLFVDRISVGDTCFMLVNAKCASGNVRFSGHLLNFITIKQISWMIFN